MHRVSYDLPNLCTINVSKFQDVTTYLTTLGRKRGRKSRTDVDPVANLVCSVLKQKRTRRKRHRKGCAKRRRKERLQKYECEDDQSASAESWEKDTNSDNESFAENGSRSDGDSEIN